MADPILLAKRADLDTFLASYDPRTTPRYRSSSTDRTVLFGALANRDTATRLAIANRLLDDGAAVDVITKDGNLTLLHVLFSTHHRIEPELHLPLLRRLLDGGAPINVPCWKGGTELAMLVAMMMRDEDKAPMYELFFARPDLNPDVRVGRRPTVRETIERAGQNRPILYRMMQDWSRRQ